MNVCICIFVCISLQVYMSVCPYEFLLVCRPASLMSIFIQYFWVSMYDWSCVSLRLYIRTHVRLFVSLSIWLDICSSVLSLMKFIYNYACLHASLCMSVCTLICEYICVTVSLAVRPSVCLSVCGPWWLLSRSIFEHVYQFLCLRIYLYVWYACIVIIIMPDFVLIEIINCYWLMFDCDSKFTYLLNLDACRN